MSNKISSDPVFSSKRLDFLLIMWYYIFYESSKKKHWPSSQEKDARPKKVCEDPIIMVDSATTKNN